MVDPVGSRPIIRTRSDSGGTPRRGAEEEAAKHVVSEGLLNIPGQLPNCNDYVRQEENAKFWLRPKKT